MSTRPPFDPTKSDGCSVPKALQARFPVLKEMCRRASVRRLCLAHDEAYYYGGTAQEFHDANNKFYEGLIPEIGLEWAAEWYGAVNTVGWSHWGTGCAWDGRALWAAAGTEAP